METSKNTLMNVSLTFQRKVSSVLIDYAPTERYINMVFEIIQSLFPNIMVIIKIRLEFILANNFSI